MASQRVTVLTITGKGIKTKRSTMTVKAAKKSSRKRNKTIRHHHRKQKRKSTNIMDFY